VRVRSLERLDVALAWRHVLHRAQRAVDVPDRLPFEVLERITDGSPSLSPEQHLRPVHLVVATKASGVFRPFVRMSALDLLLYQALVDALAPDIEQALGPRDRVFAYRQDLSGASDPFEGSPRWGDFIASVRARLELGAGLPFSPSAATHQRQGYVLTTDVASFFIYIDIDELERRLLAISDQTDIVRDVGAFLRGLQQLGVRGLPQGVPPSSPLGNFYLNEMDQALVAAGVDYRRYMDDAWMFVDTYAEARQLQDHVERVLYEDRLSLGGDKVRIRRVATAQREAQTAGERLRLRQEAMFLEAAGETYDADEEIEIDAAEIDEAAVHDEYDELLEGVRADEFVENTRSRFIATYRELERGQDPYGIDDVPDVLTRLPDLTAHAVRYVARAARADPESARDAPSAERARPLPSGLRVGPHLQGVPLVPRAAVHASGRPHERHCGGARPPARPRASTPGLGRAERGARLLGGRCVMGRRGVGLATVCSRRYPGQGGRRPQHALRRLER
jgi:hypothetical protein